MDWKKVTDQIRQLIDCANDLQLTCSRAISDTNLAMDRQDQEIENLQARIKDLEEQLEIAREDLMNNKRAR